MAARPHAPPRLAPDAHALRHLGEGLAAALLPKGALDFLTQSWHAEVLHQLVAQAAHVREAGEDSPFSRAMEKERQYYAELSKRIARYLNARE